MPVPSVGSFGKLPWHGDFLRDAPPGAPLELLDAWLAPAPIGPPGPRSEAFDNAGPTMAMVKARGTWWAMALFPSRDAVGRRYPFCVLAGLPEAEFDGEPGLVPLVWTPFLVRCLQQAARGWPQTQGELRAAVAACGQPLDIDSESRRLVESLADHRCSEFWRGTLGSVQDPRIPGVWADLVALAAAPDRAIGVRVRPMMHQLHLAWVLILQQLTGGTGCSPVFIAMQPGRPGDAPGATVLWGRPTAGECLAALWPAMPGADSGRIHDPVQRPGTFGDADAAPLAIDDPGSSLRDLLHLVGRVNPHVRRSRPA